MHNPAIPEFVVLDVETTGLDPKNGHEIIEIGAQKLRGHEVIGQFEALLKPTRPLPADVVDFHAKNGITQKILDEEGRAADEVILELVEFIGAAVVIAHNAAFDVGFVNAHLDRLGQPPLTNKVLDTIDIAKRYLLLASYRLSNVAAYLKVEQPSAHRALVDVITTREVFFKLVERAKQKPV